MRLRSAADLGKNPPWGKTFIVIRKNPWPVGKTYNGKNSFEKPITYLRRLILDKPTILLGKTLRKTHLGKTYCQKLEGLGVESCEFSRLSCRWRCLRFILYRSFWLALSPGWLDFVPRFYPLLSFMYSLYITPISKP